MKKLLLICISLLSAMMVYGQTELPKTKEVPGFIPGMTITLHLDPATGEYVEKQELRRKRNGKIPRSQDRTPRHRARARARYQGELNAVYVLGSGTRSYNRVGAETIHGVRINPYLFCGIGVGVNYYYKSKEWDRDNYVGAKFIPVFVDFKYYFFNTKVSPYLKLDAGYGTSSSARLYVSPSIGLKCSLTSTMAINFDLGYQAQQVNEYGSADVLDGVVFRLGWSF